MAAGKGIGRATEATQELERSQWLQRGVQWESSKGKGQSGARREFQDRRSNSGTGVLDNRAAFGVSRCDLKIPK